MPMPKYLTYLTDGLMVVMVNCKLEATRRLARTVGPCPVLVLCDRASTVEAYWGVVVGVVFPVDLLWGSERKDENKRSGVQKKLRAGAERAPSYHKEPVFWFSRFATIGGEPA